MKIAVNTRLLLQNKLDGIGWFTYETLKRITTERPNDEFIFIFDRPFDPEFIFGDNVTPVCVSPPSRHPFLWYIWFEHSLPHVFKKYKPHVFLSPDGYLSLSANVPSLAVIHDLNFEHYPKDLPFWYRKYYRHYFPKYAQKATRIATVSEFSKNDIINQYRVSASKIDVVYNGISALFKPQSTTEKLISRKEFAYGKPYFVFVGTLHPRKNIARMLQAFDQFKNSGNHAHNLVVIGRRKWWTANMESTLQSMVNKSAVIFHENIPQEKVAKAVGGADAMLYTSTFEGFGIPILEGMQSGIPVITSNVTSMPEIAGDSALFCDPFSPSSIGEQISRVVLEPNLSEKTIEKGIHRAQEFSWDRTSELLSASIDNVI